MRHLASMMSPNSAHDAAQKTQQSPLHDHRYNKCKSDALFTSRKRQIELAYLGRHHLNSCLQSEHRYSVDSPETYKNPPIHQ
jgi:hypothetical protein